MKANVYCIVYQDFISFERFAIMPKVASQKQQKIKSQMFKSDVSTDL
jgi:hypothetical protein